MTVRWKGVMLWTLCFGFEQLQDLREQGANSPSAQGWLEILEHEYWLQIRPRIHHFPSKCCNLMLRTAITYQLWSLSKEHRSWVPAKLSGATPLISRMLSRESHNIVVFCSASKRHHKQRKPQRFIASSFGGSGFQFGLSGGQVTVAAGLHSSLRLWNLSARLLWFLSPAMFLTLLSAPYLHL